MTETRSAAPAPHAWAVVAVLLVAYVLSFIDRQILSLLIEPVRRDLGLSDFQMAWVGPPAFATFFLLFGLVFGRLADRVRRTRLVALGIFIWCVMTAACAFVESAVGMFIARMGVGLGEAVLTPCALSLISDLFARDRVGKPIGLYSMGVSLGSSLAFILGGALFAWLTATGHDPFASLGVTAPWRETFLIVGLPGLLLVPVFLLMREPPRRERVGAAQPSLGEAARFLGSQARVFVPLFCGKAVFNFIAYAHFWIVPLFQRTWGWELKSTGQVWGFTLLGSGLVGVMLGGWLSDRWYRAGRKDAALRVVWWGLLLTLPLHALAPLMPSGELALMLFVPALVAAGAGSSAGSTATMLATPNEYRGQVTALSLLIASGLGQLLGPTSVAFTTDFVFRDPQALRYSLAIAVLVFSLVAFAVLSWGLRHYRAAVEGLEARVGAERP